MCNNRPMPVMKKVEKEMHTVKSAIALNKSDENIVVKLNARQKVNSDNKAKEYRTYKDGVVIYSELHPLKMLNGTEVYSIVISDHNDKSYKNATIEFKSTIENPENRVWRRKVRIHENEKWEDIEEFLTTCVSCAQIVNIDLDFLEGKLETA